jgi:oligosaccharide repeat unit polymerase
MKREIKANKKDAFISVFKIIVLVQFLVALMEIILPANSIYANGSYRFLINIGFYFLVLFISLFIRDVFKNKSRQSSQKRLAYLSVKKLYLLLNISSLLGFFGVSFILFDRVFLKNIDYSLGLRHARYQWVNAKSPSIFSELLSMFGNALVPMAFITVLLLYLYWEEIEKKFRFKRLIISISAVFLFAAMNGSRSIIFIQVFLLLCISILRLSKDKKLIPAAKKNKKSDKKFYIIFMLSVIYALGMFKSSSKLGNVDSKSLFEIFIVDLGGKPKTGYYSIINSIIGPDSIIYHIFSAITYLIHSQWTSEGLISLTNRTGNIFTYAIMHFLYQLGILNSAPESYQFYGLFISLPGAIAYDFGIVGVVIFGVLYGVLLGLSLIKIEKPNNSGGFDFAIIMFVLSSILVAPFFVAHNFIYFNFIIIDMMILEIISRVFIRKSTWLYLDKEKTFE